MDLSYIEKGLCFLMGPNSVCVGIVRVAQERQTLHGEAPPGAGGRSDQVIIQHTHSGRLDVYTDSHSWLRILTKSLLISEFE
jgi:hypothetical protein